MTDAPDTHPPVAASHPAPDGNLASLELAHMPQMAMLGVMDGVSDLVCICIDGKIRHLNTSGLSILGAASLDDVLGITFQDLVSDDFAATIGDIIAVLADEADAMPMRLKGVDGLQRSLRLRAVRLPDLGDTAFVVLGENVTRQAELTDAIHQSQSRFRNLVNNALDLICVLKDDQITYINKAGVKLLKAPSRDDIVGRHLAEFLHDNYKDIFTGDIRELVAEDMLLPVHFVDFHQGIIDAEIGITILDSGRGETFMIEARDITAHNRAVTALRQSIENLEHRVQERTRELMDEVAERRRAEEMLRHVATHDGLTDLPNRSLLLDRLDTAIARAKRAQNSCAVVFIDLDGFKPINDTFGHDKGDLVLREVAKRLQGCIREADTAARFGGDEFVIVLGDLHKTEDATVVAQKVLDALAIPIDLDGQDAHVGASIGIALFPDHADSAEAVLKLADDAMYDVKGHGKNDYVIANTIVSVAATGTDGPT